MSDERTNIKLNTGTSRRLKKFMAHVMKKEYMIRVLSQNEIANQAIVRGLSLLEKENK